MRTRIEVAAALFTLLAACGGGGEAGDTPGGAASATPSPADAATGDAHAEALRINFGYSSYALPIQPFGASKAGVAGNWPYGGLPAFYSWATGTASSLPAAPALGCVPRWVASISDGGVVFGTCFSPDGSVVRGIYWPSPTSAPVALPTVVGFFDQFLTMVVTSGSQDPATGELHAVGYGTVRGLLSTFNAAFKWRSSSGLQLFSRPGPARVNSSGYAVTYDATGVGPETAWRPDGSSYPLPNAQTSLQILDSGAILTGLSGIRILNLDGSIAVDDPDPRLSYPAAIGPAGRIAGGGVAGPAWTFYQGAFQSIPLPPGSIAGDYLKPVWVDGCGTIVSATYGAAYANGWGKGGAVTRKLLCDSIGIVLQ
jgi:hypothetical protein